MTTLKNAVVSNAKIIMDGVADKIKFSYCTFINCEFVGEVPDGVFHVCIFERCTFPGDSCI